ncbi:hypothetical protein ACN47E_006536 [Coniothyrium glycines]
MSGSRAADEEPARKRLRCAQTEGPDITCKTITVHVGPAGASQELQIHESLLLRSSEFFDNALSNDWKEGVKRIVRLPEIDLECFEIWAKWLYTGRIHLTQESDVSREDGRVTANMEWARWSETYEAASYLQDNDFKDALIDCMIEAMQTVANIPTKLANFIYPHSPASSNHRKLAIDVCVHAKNRQTWRELEKLLTEFMVDVLARVGPLLADGLKLVGPRQYFNLADTCKYHDHGADKPCYKTKPPYRL